MAKKTTGTMTANSRKVFDYLKGNGVGVKFTHKEVADALGFENTAAVVGSVTGLVNKELAVREKETRTVDGKDKEVSVFWLTEKGAQYDPDAVAAAASSSAKRDWRSHELRRFPNSLLLKDLFGGIYIC